MELKDLLKEDGITRAGDGTYFNPYQEEGE